MSDILQECKERLNHFASLTRPQTEWLILEIERLRGKLNFISDVALDEVNAGGKR